MISPRAVSHTFVGVALAVMILSVVGIGALVALMIRDGLLALVAPLHALARLAQ